METMAENKSPSRRTTDKRGGGQRQAPPKRTTEKVIRRTDVIRCENCGEDYSVTYKRCPFCDERPGRTGIGGRRAAGGGQGPVNPIQVIGLVISLVLIITALFIVFKYIGPLLFGEKDPAGSSVSTSQSQGSQDSSSAGSGSDTSQSQGGDVSQPETPDVSVTSITLNKTDITLRSDEIITLVATVAPAGADVTVQWSSSNTDVLTVDADGTLKNVNKGTSLTKVIVTASAGDKSAECIVYCRPSGTASGGSETGGQTGTGTGSTSGPVSPNTPGTIVNAGSGLNIRSGPGSDYEKVASASNGAKIVILEDTGTGWYKIDYGGGKTGYVSSDYVSVGG